jgi:hypothetical protein
VSFLYGPVVTLMIQALVALLDDLIGEENSDNGYANEPTDENLIGYQLTSPTEAGTIPCERV